MPGALMTVIANSTGTEHAELTHNPQFSFFKTVFRRYTNFATEPIEIPLVGSDTLHFDGAVTLKAIVPRHAELLSHLYLAVDLPAIFSGYDPTLADATTKMPSVQSGYRFQWVRELGAQMVERVQVSVGGTVVQELRGEWISLWYRSLAAEDVDLSLYNTLTGNTPELYDPANGVGAMGVYPTSTLHSDLNTDPELRTDPASASSVTNPFFRTASIPAQTLYVPFPFWFSANSGAALPLVALQHHEVEVQVTLRPLRDLYTVRDVNPTSPTFGDRVPPQPTVVSHAIGRFQAGMPYASMEASSTHLGLGDGLENNENLTVAPRLLATYVFLDDAEQSQFASATHRYLVEQVNYLSFRGVYGTQSYDLHLNHPVKMLVWYAQREDVRDRNDWTNYTNNTTPGGEVGSTTLQAHRPSTSESVFQRVDDSGTNDVLLRGFVNERVAGGGAASVAPASKFEFPRTSPEILKDATILFNGVHLFSAQQARFFRTLQPLQCRLRPGLPGVYVYSWALNSRAVRQPSGACDTSRVKQVKLQVSTVDRNADSDTAYELRVFVVRYNVLRLMGGMGGVEFAN